MYETKLKELAKDKGVKNISKLKKEELIEEISNIKDNYGNENLVINNIADLQKYYKKKTLLKVSFFILDFSERSPHVSLFTIADLHLSLATDHQMDVFGSRWKDYTKKLEKNWRAIICDEDTVIIPGDISWSLKLEDSLEDVSIGFSLSDFSEVSLQQENIYAFRREIDI